MTMARKIIATLGRLTHSRRSARHDKTAGELLYWTGQASVEGTLANDHYEYFYTEHFGLSSRFFSGLSILDIGCGPRGSLEWAREARIRAGADPLAVAYRSLGTGAHLMAYVAGTAERLPFRSGAFDVVSAFNSLDHVDVLHLAIDEIIRVLKPGGLCLLLTDVHRALTPLEPTRVWWDVLDRFRGNMRVLREEHFEKIGTGLYESARSRVSFNHGDATERYGVLSALLVREERGSTSR